MARKAGIIIGLLVVTLAISLWFIFGDSKPETRAGGGKTPPASVVKKQPQSSANTSEQVGTTSSTQVEEKTEQVSDESSNEQIKSQPQTVTTKEVTTTSQVNPSAEKKPKQEFLKIDEEGMGQSVISRSEVMVVAKKEVIVLDGAVGTKKSKQLVYAVQMLSGSDRFSLFLNGVVYKQVNVGEKLKVDYDVYRNDNGVDFPVVMNATVVK